MFALAFDDLRHRLLEKHGVREDAVEHGLLAHKVEAKRREGSPFISVFSLLHPKMR